MGGLGGPARKSIGPQNKLWKNKVPIWGFFVWPGFGFFMGLFFPDEGPPVFNEQIKTLGNVKLESG